MVRLIAFWERYACKRIVNAGLKEHRKIVMYGDVKDNLDLRVYLDSAIGIWVCDFGDRLRQGTT